MAWGCFIEDSLENDDKPWNHKQAETTTVRIVISTDNYKSQTTTVRIIIYTDNYKSQTTTVRIIIYTDNY